MCQANVRMAHARWHPVYVHQAHTVEDPHVYATSAHPASGCSAPHLSSALELRGQRPAAPCWPMTPQSVLRLFPARRHAGIDSVCGGVLRMEPPLYAMRPYITLTKTAFSMCGEATMRALEVSSPLSIFTSCWFVCMRVINNGTSGDAWLGIPAANCVQESSSFMSLGCDVRADRGGMSPWSCWLATWSSELQLPACHRKSARPNPTGSAYAPLYASTLSFSRLCTNVNVFSVSTSSSCRPRPP